MPTADTSEKWLETLIGSSLVSRAGSGLPICRTWPGAMDLLAPPCGGAEAIHEADEAELIEWRGRMCWLNALPQRCRRGSYPRCLKLMHGRPSEVREKLTNLVGVDGIHVPGCGRWMPKGPPHQQQDGLWDLEPTLEARLGEDRGFLTCRMRCAVTNWWLAVVRNANTPNWDIASTCLVDGKRGLLLVEAKAHRVELSPSGKSQPQAQNGERNDRKIRDAVAEANNALNQLSPDWSLSCDHHYQISNRFAWSWKLASMGVPVVLMYLGFLKVTEMRDKCVPFPDHHSWEKAVLAHSEGIVPNIWGQRLWVNGTPMIALIRSIQVDLPQNAQGAG